MPFRFSRDTFGAKHRELRDLTFLHCFCISGLCDVAVVQPCGPEISASPDACFLSRSRDGIRACRTAPRP
jgi:hypothetical protein